MGGSNKYETIKALQFEAKNLIKRTTPITQSTLRTNVKKRHVLGNNGDETTTLEHRGEQEEVRIINKVPHFFPIRTRVTQT